MDKQIGYPDYLASDNNTKLENDFAEVNSFEMIVSSIDRDALFSAVHFRFIVHWQCFGTVKNQNEREFGPSAQTSGS